MQIEDTIAYCNVYKIEKPPFRNMEIYICV